MNGKGFVVVSPSRLMQRVNKRCYGRRYQVGICFCATKEENDRVESDRSTKGTRKMSLKENGIKSKARSKPQSEQVRLSEALAKQSTKRVLLIASRAVSKKDPVLANIISCLVVVSADPKKLSQIAREAQKVSKGRHDIKRTPKGLLVTRSPKLANEKNAEVEELKKTIKSWLVDVDSWEAGRTSEDPKELQEEIAEMLEGIKGRIKWSRGSQTMFRSRDDLIHRDLYDLETSGTVNTVYVFGGDDLEAHVEKRINDNDYPPELPNLQKLLGKVKFEPYFVEKSADNKDTFRINLDVVKGFVRSYSNAKFKYEKIMSFRVVAFARKFLRFIKAPSSWNTCDALTE